MTMRFGQFVLLVLICWNVSCSLHSDDDRLNQGKLLCSVYI